MSTRRSRQTRGSTGLVVTLLGLVALIGLLLGILAHTLASRGGGGVLTGSTSGVATTTATSAAHTPPATTSATHSPSAAATATDATTSAAASDHFQLSISISPRTVAPGQQLTVTVKAFTPDTHAPVAGLACNLRAPSDGSAALLSAWPGPQTTNSDGAATWTLTAPTLAAGTYEVEAFAKTSKWSWKADSTVTIVAG